MALKNKDVEGEVINLASGVPISIREIIEIVRGLVGKGSPEFGKIPYRIGENMSLYADTKKANKILKWTPETFISDGIKKTIISQNL
jgi:nucleoside-diphosphate-sugar epimerase